MTSTQTSEYPDYYSDTQEFPLSDDELLATDGQGTVLAVYIQKPKKTYYWLGGSIVAVAGFLVAKSMFQITTINLCLVIPISLFLAFFSFAGYHYIDMEECTFEEQQDEIIFCSLNLLAKEPFVQLQTLTQDKKKLPRKDRAKPATLFLQSFFVKKLPTNIIWDQGNISERKGKYKVSQYLAFDGSNYQLRQVTTPTSPMMVPPLP